MNYKKKQERQSRPAIDISTLVYGKVPPQAKEMEQATLGALMLERDAFDSIADMLRPEMFYTEAHVKIFEAIQSLNHKSQPVDTLTVAEELRSGEALETCGGTYYLHSLTTMVVSSAHIAHHARIIIQKFIQRELIRIGGQVAMDAFEDAADPFQLLDEAEEAFSQIGQALDFGEMTPIDNVLVKAIQKIEEYRLLDTEITGVSSGFKELDKATRGWQNGDLIIIAARPSVGKTALALNVVRNAATSFLERNTKQSVAVWSLEMKSVVLILRMLAAESRAFLHKIQTGRLGEQDMKNIYRNGVQKLSQLKVFFDDRNGLTIQKLRSKARKLKKKNKLGLIVLDYLQLMTPEERSGNREQEVSKISRNLKNLAQELDIPIIALSQMSREFEKRDGLRRIPQLSDLRESGSLEQDADVVMFLWGPTDDDIAKDATLLNRRFLRIAKQRNGNVLKIELDFKDEIQLFTDIDKQLPSFGEPGSNWRPIVDFSSRTTTSIDSPGDPEDKLPF